MYAVYWHIIVNNGLGRSQVGSVNTFWSCLSFSKILYCMSITRALQRCVCCAQQMIEVFSTIAQQLCCLCILTLELGSLQGGGLFSPPFTESILYFLPTLLKSIFGHSMCLLFKFFFSIFLLQNTCYCLVFAL